MIANGLASTHSAPAAIASPVASQGNAWGAVCEGCGYQPPGGNPYLLAGTSSSGVLDYQLTAIMQTLGAGKNVVVYNDVTADLTARKNALAIIGLVFDASHLFEGETVCGTSSLVHVCPEAGVTFGQPLAAYPASPSSLRDATTGVYVREFSGCAINGGTAFPCAAVFNPQFASGGNAAPMPTLSRSYAHQLTITAGSLCGCFGDAQGSVLMTSTAPTTLGQVSGAILVP